MGRWAQSSKATNARGKWGTGILDTTTSYIIHNCCFHSFLMCLFLSISSTLMRSFQQSLVRVPKSFFDALISASLLIFMRYSWITLDWVLLSLLDSALYAKEIMNVLKPFLLFLHDCKGVVKVSLCARLCNGYNGISLVHVGWSCSSDQSFWRVDQTNWCGSVASKETACGS